MRLVRYRRRKKALMLCLLEKHWGLSMQCSKARCSFTNARLEACSSTRRALEST